MIWCDYLLPPDLIDRQVFFRILSSSSMSFDSSRSSGQRSKRSLDSDSSRSLSNSNPKKKKDANQKTLGVAWGANSRSSFRNSPFSDFGSYMNIKNAKLHNQFDAEASTSSHCGLSSEKPIFQGVSIFVDGFTIPSSQELRGYMLKYGGRYENYFSRYRVTHIICTNLPNSKMKNLRSFSGGLPVVKPTWILDSIAANKLLSWIPYKLDQLVANQPQLSAFFAPKVSSASVNVLHVNCETEDTSLKGDTEKDDNSSKVSQSLDGGGSGEIMHYADASIEEPSIGKEIPFEVKIVEKSNFAEQDVNSANNCLCTSLSKSNSVSVSSFCSDNHDTKGLLIPVAEGSHQSHSTPMDPNFVEKYFKSSRLHFIGTWRNRYRKHFASLSNKCGVSNLSVPVDSRKTVVIHIDMDCFFVSVVIREHPELMDKPVAISHSDNPKGTAEISSANYPARNFGVRAGMFVRDAKALCPQLIIFPYNFEAYEEVADKFYNILHKHCNKVQAVSCDEAFLDAADFSEGDPELLASKIREEIFETTGCTASAGIANNMLLSRLATRTAKPNGQCYIPPEKVDDYLHILPIKSLPGIGYVLEDKLKKLGVETCGKLRMISKESLVKDFGRKTGEMLWSYSRGIDNRLIGMIQESKSIGAEVNWGVRFKDSKDSKMFLSNLCKEVSLRLQGCGMQGRTFTLKLKKRRKGAGEPDKYMGCGDCENLSHSITVPMATDDVEVMQRITKQLFGLFRIDVKEIRGLGLQVSRLESSDSCNQGIGNNTLKSWLISTSASPDEEFLPKDISWDKAISDGYGPSANKDLYPSCGNKVIIQELGGSNQSSGESCRNWASAPPPISHLDFRIVESLPAEVFSELNEVYGGRLVDFVSKSKGKCESPSRDLLHKPVEGVINKEEVPVFDDVASPNAILKDEKEKKHTEVQATCSVRGSRNVDIPTLCLENTDLMPASLSQVDATVLKQLPEELKVDILALLPRHRKQGFPSNALCDQLEYPPASSDIMNIKNHLESTGSASKYSLWVGNPPKWVDEFERSKCMILNHFAKMYYKSGSNGKLSSILRCTIIGSKQLLDTTCEDRNEALCSFCEIFKQYIKLKVELDIEEIYVCFLLLRRSILKSNFLLQVFEAVFPYLQTSVSECYGGSLHLPLE